jgi:hypothetical protein
VRRARGEIIPSRIGEREALAIFLDSIEIQLQLIVYDQEWSRVEKSPAPPLRRKLSPQRTPRTRRTPK